MLSGQVCSTLGIYVHMHSIRRLPPYYIYVSACMLNEMQPLSKRRFLITTRTATTTVTATAAATPPTAPPTTDDVELGAVSDELGAVSDELGAVSDKLGAVSDKLDAVSDDAEVELAF